MTNRSQSLVRFPPGRVIGEVKRRLVGKNAGVTPQQLEARVLAAVDALRSSGQIEDDRIEVKREWPSVEKARQLCGAANRARGDELIYIIGLDEKTGAIHPTRGTDVADWWSQMSARFDQLPPGLVRHLNVTVESGESVTVLEFSTNRAPYLVTTSGGSPEREVPIRDGTRTRSATRDELMRMLIPEIGTPPVVLLEGQLSGSWYAPRESKDGRDGRPESTSVHGTASIYIEHVGPAGILFPAHEMSWELHAGDIQMHGGVDLRGPRKDAPPPPAFGVHSRFDGFAATGPGRASLSFSWSREGDHRGLGRIESWNLTLLLGVTGSSRPARVEGALESYARESAFPDSAFQQSLGQWRYSR